MSEKKYAVNITDISETDWNSGSRGDVVMNQQEKRSTYEYWQVNQDE
jgi:hypothetical protein